MIAGSRTFTEAERVARAGLGGVPSAFVTAVVAALTAVVVGVLISGVAGAAHAAALNHTQAVQLQANDASAASSQTAAQLSAYRDRLQQAYGQLQSTYQLLETRDAAYRQQLATAAAGEGKLAAANQTSAAKLAAAYQQIQQASGELQSLQASYQRLMAAYQQLQQAQQPVAAAPGLVTRRGDDRGRDD